MDPKNVVAFGAALTERLRILCVQQENGEDVWSLQQHRNFYATVLQQSPVEEAPDSRPPVTEVVYDSDTE